MKQKIFDRGVWSLIGAIILLFAVFAAPIIAQNVACYADQGGAAWHLGSGCTYTVESGGVLNVASGGALKIAGTDKTASIAGLPATTNYAVGVASGYKIARGTITLDGTNPSSAAHGLTTVVACTITDVRTTAPGADPTAFTYTIATTNIDVYAWKPTAQADTALVASTDADDVIAWICVGT